MKCINFICILYSIKFFHQSKCKAFREKWTRFLETGPKSKMTISRQRFYKWLHAYAEFKTGLPAIEGRDMIGRWIRLQEPEEEAPF